MKMTAATSMTKNAAPTDDPTIIAVASNSPENPGNTGMQAAADTLPEEGVVCSAGHGMQDVDELVVE
jgi:hypothetical protein